MSGSAASTSALGGLGGSLEEKDGDLLCPVCFELIEEAYVTRCGHSFCYACIAKSVELHRRCPKCGAALASREHIFPNFLLNELVAKKRLARPRPSTPGSSVGQPSGDAERLRALVASSSRHLAMPDVERMLDVLQRRKRLLEAESAAAHHRLLYEFLKQLHRHRSHQLEQLAREAQLVRKDMEHVCEVLRDLRSGAASLAKLPAVASDEEEAALRCELQTLAGNVGDSAGQLNESRSPTGGPGIEEESFASSVGGTDALASRWRRLTQHFDDFVQCYFAHRADELYFPGAESPAAPASPPGARAPAAPAPAPAGVCDDHVPQAPALAPHAPGDQTAPDTHIGSTSNMSMGPALEDTSRAASAAGGGGGLRGLDAFREDLVAFTRYRALRPLATLSYCSDAINYSTIVSTIEFDKDEEFFAIAGVTKRIKVFEFEAVVRDAVDVHYPCAEMQCSHKISCVSWNAYHKNVIASSDYEGTVSVWDAGTGQRTRALQEHDKRCWSVHFNRADVRLLASGSDDARVKLWALNAERSVATLEAKFNVCCVRFNPRSSCHLAFGSADHCVHYYDLRAPRTPLAVFRDHRKAVSYVKFLDAKTLVSASTDSQLKLWRVESPRCVRSFTGHANEKNFVGLATDGKYVACGSENNALYVYYSGLSRPLLAYRFDAVRGFLERERRDEEPSEFVSAVCWRRAADSRVLLAANSQGTIKVLELV
ncbi:E3 ubiquitin-protein ligase COP1-like isoform X2 [Plodia interpunctella]|uniref:E3 ubiquitin-protein ligase COP1-like isoform X2 n=1 Tax=Plodia interpunctella TaxID=58824 RepID=UPI0023674C5A|nr:E3 ubiquitin-protein ligase COP1-like isoform X2 [Plodia interpunctella]